MCGIGMGVSHGEEKEMIGTNKFIVENASVREFSKWGMYYDWQCAGEETLREYLNDSIEFKKQVVNFLGAVEISNDDKDEEDMRIIEESNNIRDKEIVATKILKRIGFKFNN